jgi:hypothetical protein
MAGMTRYVHKTDEAVLDAERWSKIDGTLPAV